MVSIKLKFGSGVIEASGNTGQEAIAAIAPFAAAQTALAKAGENPDDWQIEHKTPKGFNFYLLINKIDGRELKFGEAKDGDRLFCAGEITAAYQGGGGSSQGGGGYD